MFTSPEPVNDHASGQAMKPRPGSWAGVTVCAFGLSLCITTLNLAARGMMDLGGFVASGGPYAITHPAPSWHWIWPVSFVGVWIFAAAHAIFSSRLDGFGLIWASWCALFLWAGVSFLQYGFSPPGGHGIAWGWIVSGIVFTPIGAVPALLFFTKNPLNPLLGKFVGAPRGLRVAYYVLHALAIASGVATGLWLFAAMAGRRA
jgi:hypothetical protein